MLKVKVFSFTMFLMMMLSLYGGPAYAGEVTVDLDADVSFLTNYVWRGQNLGENGVIQPNISIGFAKGLSLGVWANYNINDSRYSSDHLVNEVDYTLDYSFDSGPLEISLGYILYDFPRADGLDTAEVYAGASLNMFLTPTLTFYRDVHEVEGTYVAFEIGHDLELDEKSMLSLSASFGWGNEAYHKGYFGVDNSSLSDFNLSAALSYALTDKVSVTPIISYSSFTLADDDKKPVSIEKAADLLYEDENLLYGGVNVSYSF